MTTKPFGRPRRRKREEADFVLTVEVPRPLMPPGIYEAALTSARRLRYRCCMGRQTVSRAFHKKHDAELWKEVQVQVLAAIAAAREDPINRAEEVMTAASSTQR